MVAYTWEIILTMNEENLNNNILNLLEDQELLGITFITRYIQFIFVEALLNTYTLPHLKIDKKIIPPEDLFYSNNLLILIVKKLVILMKI